MSRADERDGRDDDPGDVLPDDVASLTQTAVAVYLALRAAKRALTYAELASVLDAPESAVERAVRDLRDAGCVVSVPSSDTDTQRLYHRVADDPAG